MGWSARALGRLSLAAAILPAVALAKSATFDSLDWITLTSERIALVRVEAVFDSAYTLPPRTTMWGAPRAQVIFRRIQYRVLRDLAGSGPRLGPIGDRVEPSPAPQPGDTLLVLWQGEGSRLWVQHLPMSTARSGRLFAVANDFSLFHSPDSALAAVERRLRMIKANRPLGDDRRWRHRDFMQGRGRLIYWIPDDTEAGTLETGSRNMLVLPADADRLPAILAESKSSDPKDRAAAAVRLKEYPGPTAIARLREMLADDGTVTVEGTRGGVSFTESVYIVRGQAYRSLTAMGVRAPRPPGFESDSTYLETFAW